MLLELSVLVQVLSSVFSLVFVPQIHENFFLSVDLLIIICSVLEAQVDQKLCGGGSNADGGG